MKSLIAHFMIGPVNPLLHIFFSDGEEGLDLLKTTLTEWLELLTTKEFHLTMSGLVMTSIENLDRFETTMEFVPSHSPSDTECHIRYIREGKNITGFWIHLWKEGHTFYDGPLNQYKPS